MKLFLHKLRSLSQRRRKEQELREELEFHLDEEAEQHQADGLAAAQAREAARRDLGNLTITQENTRAMWTWTILEQLVQDLRFALRTMAKNRGFTALAVLSMALGIGANTAIYSCMDSILLRSLPVDDPESLVVLNWHSKVPRQTRTSQRAVHVMHSMDGSTYDDPRKGMIAGIFPYAAFELIGRTDSVFSHVFAHYPSGNRTVQIKGQADRAGGAFVSGDYFRGLGVVPAAGRLIAAEDDRVGAPPVAVLSFALSNRRFGGPANATGQSILIDNVPFTVAGVAPPEFFGVDPALSPDFYLPLRTNLVVGGEFTPNYIDQNYYWLEIMGRLRPGVSLSQAQAVLAPAFQNWVASTAANAEEQANLPALVLKQGAGGLDSLRRQFSKPLNVLLVLVGLILALACANTANLLLARATARRRELALRRSLGAGRLRIIRQLLTEGVLLSTLGGAIGVLVAVWGIRFLTLLLANGNESFALRADLNWQVLGFTVALSLLSGVLFGLAPAIQATRTDAMPALKETRGSVPGMSAHRAFFRINLSQILVAAQIAMFLLILVAAGLFARTLANLQSVQLGFMGEGVLLFQLNARQAGHQDPEIVTFYSDLRDRFEAIPGVRNASLSHASLLKAGRQHPVSVAGVPAPGTRFLYTGPGFLTTMQIPLLRGREIDRRDQPGSPAVAVVNELFAKSNFGTRDPLGQHLKIGGTGAREVEIIGVCANTRYGGLKRDMPPVVFLAYNQVLQFSRVGQQMTYALRITGDPASYVKAIREIVTHADARIPVTDIITQTAEIDQTINQEIVFAKLSMGFAILALVIACVGLYGTVSYNVARRTSEIGIRMALGAARADVVWMVLRDVLVAASIGLAVGLPVTLGTSRYVESFLFKMNANDPLSLSLAVIVLLCAVLVAGFVPARKATRIDPTVALRQE
ncbi:MAG: ABC transporter permease [Acidobacteria bacterium]|nr:ABC transporter permease [Acidobacteriota bacterium]